MTSIWSNGAYHRLCMKTATKTGRLYQLCWGSFQSTENKLLSGTCSFEAGIHSNESPGTMVVNKLINTAYNDHMWLSKSLTVTSFWELTEFSPCRMFCNRLWYNRGTYSLNMLWQHGSCTAVCTQHFACKQTLRKRSVGGKQPFINCS